MKQSNKHGIFPIIPNNVANAIHDAVCDQLGVNSASEEHSGVTTELCNDEVYICSECKEWTSEEDSCCGVGPSNHEYERDYER